MIMVKSITHFIRYEKLKMHNHFLEMLTATVSHDMRTPLNAILGIGKNLEAHLKTEQGGRYLKIMMNSGKLLDYLVNDMIDLFRIRNGKFSSNETSVDL
jgi:signal transduction histidine kinase